MGSHRWHSRSPVDDNVRFLAACEPDSLCAVRPSIGQGSIPQCYQQAGARRATTGAAIVAAVAEEKLLCMLTLVCLFGGFTASATTRHQLTWGRILLCIRPFSPRASMAQTTPASSNNSDIQS
jgi:hypothetical protein